MEPSQIDLDGYVERAVVTSVHGTEGIIAGPIELEGRFTLSFFADAGEVRFICSAPVPVSDPRPLALRVSRLTINGRQLDLSAPTLLQKELPRLPANESFSLLDRAADLSRSALEVRLTDGRGPWSSGLEKYIAEHVSDYDLVVTHNNVFRPAVFVIEEAHKQKVPSILIPHTHLDDDFYHFPDLLESAKKASLVLASPKAACDFLARKGCEVSYLPAGCDVTEQFTEEDRESFRQVHHSTRPFLLVLGRKAGAKGYQYVIDAVEQLNQSGEDLQVVLIGPDDDGVPVGSANVIYLGRQPRNVVRGALLSCFSLCNMSSSESFGIVLLEAWLAGKPVIANKNCVAFHDMAIDRENAILVDQTELAQAIRLLLLDKELGLRLANEGRKLINQFDWDVVSSLFVTKCLDITNSTGS